MLKKKVTIRRPNGDFDRGAVVDKDSVEGYLKYMDILYFYEHRTMTRDLKKVYSAGEVWAEVFVEDYFPGEDITGYFWYFTDENTGEWRAEKVV